MNLTGIRMFLFCRAVRMSDFAAFRAFTIRMTVFFLKKHKLHYIYAAKCDNGLGSRSWRRKADWDMIGSGFDGSQRVVRMSKALWDAASVQRLLAWLRRGVRLVLTKLFVNLALKSHSFDPPLSSLKRTTVDSSLVLMVSVCWPAVVRIQTNQIPQLTALYRELANGTTSVPVTRPGLSTRYTHHTIWEKNKLLS